MPIKVSLVEDNAGMRESFAALFNEAPGLRCVRTHAPGEDAGVRLPQEQPDVALVDINLPGMSGIECVARLKAQLPNLQVLMRTRFEGSETIFKALRAGASGYLLKRSLPDEIFEAIEQVRAGGAPMSMQIARKVVEHFHHIQQPKSEVDTLSKRELEVLTLLAK